MIKVVAAGKGFCSNKVGSSGKGGCSNKFGCSRKGGCSGKQGYSDKCGCNGKGGSSDKSGCSDNCQIVVAAGKVVAAINVVAVGKESFSDKGCCSQALPVIPGRRRVSPC